MALLTRKPKRQPKFDAVRTGWLSAGMLIGSAITLLVFWVLR
jgi:hypothetical protein